MEEFVLEGTSLDQRRTGLDVSTAGLQDNNKLEFWQDMARHALVGCEVSSRDPKSFHIAARGMLQGEISLLDIRCSPFRVDRDPDRSTDSSGDYILLYFVKAGRILAEQDRRSAIIGPGDAVTLVSSRPYMIEISGEHRVNSVRIPRLLFGRSPRIDEATARSLLGMRGIGRILGSLASQLCESGRGMDPLLVGRLVLNFTDLLATGYDTLPAPEANASPPRDRTLSRIRAFLELNLANPDLTPAAVADEMRLSLRYINKLFEREKVSLGRYLLEQRLDRAAATLARYAIAAGSIKAAAYDAGFRDLSHFSSAFRNRFDTTPMQYRNSISHSLGIAPYPNADLDRHTAKGQAYDT